MDSITNTANTPFPTAFRSASPRPGHVWSPSYVRTAAALGTAGNGLMEQGTGVMRGTADVAVKRIRNAEQAAPPRGERH